MKKDEELKSRRDFFKKATKSALPILGAIILSSTPFVSKAAIATGCNTTCALRCTTTCFGCKGGCTSTCKGCRYSCTEGCFGGCTYECKGGCKDNCGGQCSYNCRGGDWLND